MKPIYWRVYNFWYDILAEGAFLDLKTLAGAQKRLFKQYPKWHQIDVAFEPLSECPHKPRTALRLPTTGTIRGRV